MNSIQRNCTWILDNLLPNRKLVISTKWVFKLKTHKKWYHYYIKGVFGCARFLIITRIIFWGDICSNWQVQHVGWVVTTLATHNGWLILHLDARTTFFNGELTKEVYLQHLESFEENKVCKLPLKSYIDWNRCFMLGTPKLIHY